MTEVDITIISAIAGATISVIGVVLGQFYALSLKKREFRVKHIEESIDVLKSAYIDIRLGPYYKDFVMNRSVESLEAFAEYLMDKSDQLDDYNHRFNYIISDIEYKYLNKKIRNIRFLIGKLYINVNKFGQKTKYNDRSNIDFNKCVGSVNLIGRILDNAVSYYENARISTLNNYYCDFRRLTRP